MDLDYFKFRHPFSAMFSGPTSSGKTYLVRNILKSFKLLTSIDDNKLKVLWAYGQWQSLYSINISDNVLVNYVSGLPSEDEIKEINPHIIVIDDLMNELGDNKKFADLFTKGSHHMGISVMFITQNLFHQGRQMRTIGLNCHYLILMKSARGKAQLRHFAGDAFPGKTKFLLEAYDEATKEDPYTYIKVDFTQQTLEKYRITSCITPEEVKKFGLTYAPIVFVPK